MPCISDYMEPDRREIESAKVLKLLSEIGPERERERRLCIMTADEWDDLLNDVHAELLEPSGRRDCRHQLAERLADLECRLLTVERVAHKLIDKRIEEVLGEIRKD